MSSIPRIGLRGATFLVFVALSAVEMLATAAEATSAPTISDTQSAPASEPSSVVEVYQAPKRLTKLSRFYPYELYSNGREGWVHMQFMVGTTGKAYEVSVVDSMGSDRFTEYAISKLKRSTYQPAMANGQPIEAGHHERVWFTLGNGSTGAKASFVQTFRPLTKAIVESDQTASDLLLAKLKITNRYEDALYHYMRALYYDKWGTPRQQLVAVRRATAYLDSDKYLRKVKYLHAMQMQFRLEVEANDFAAAERTAVGLLEVEKDEAQLAIVQTTTELMAKLRDASESITVSGNLGDHTSWWMRLFRDQFRVSVIDGRIAELKLRCRKGFVFFRYDPELEYSISEGQMPCQLEIVGDLNTEFTIVQ